MKKLALLSKFFWLPLLLVVVLFNACSDSLDITFNESETRFISINAYTTRSFDNDAEKKKQDTIAPGDSLIFLTTISPSKSIRLQRYYWTMDDELFANEFSFKSTVEQEGIHKVEFVLIDFFGDTLKDHITLYVASHPGLSEKGYLPKNGSQGIAPTDLMNFAWSSNGSDSLWKIHYKFTLSNSFTGATLVDTLLDKAQFTYYKGFKPLEKYQWTVQAVNELNQKSEYILSNTFYTAGSNNESAITGILKTNSTEDNNVFDLTLTNINTAEKYQFNDFTVDKNGTFILKSLNLGKYTLLVQKKQYPDFIPDSLVFSTQEKTVLELSTLMLRDTIPPIIQHASAKDTLDVQDTLKFFVKDGGCNLKTVRINVRLEAESITAINLNGDTLQVAIPSVEKTWTYRTLTISAMDASGNKGSRTFSIKPKKTIDEVRND